MNNDVAGVLRGLYGKFGAQILAQPPRLASLLRDECPEHRREISALVKALEEHVPQDLLNSQSGEPPGSLASRLSKRLSEEHLLHREASSWAVWAWAHGLGLGDEYRSDALEQPELHSEIVVEPGPQPLPSAGESRGAPSSQVPRQQPVPVPDPLPPARHQLWPVLIAAVVLIGLGIAAKQTIFKAPPPPPPHIASIQVPPRLRVGKPYTFAIHFDSAPAGVVAVERHVVVSNVQWVEPNSNQKVSGMEAQSQGTIQYAFVPESKPLQATLQFVLVDRNGQRSQPQTVSYEVTPIPVVCNECGTIYGIERFDEARKPKGFGAVAGAVVGGLLGSLVGKGRGKTVATAAGVVGGGFAGNAIEGHMAGQSHWEITVKLNGGRKQVIESQTEPAWHVGQRVKVINGQIESL
jgi:outer membrane lipoprotein SlyB